METVLNRSSAPVLDIKRLSYINLVFDQSKFHPEFP